MVVKGFPISFAKFSEWLCHWDAETWGRRRSSVLQFSEVRKKFSVAQTHLKGRKLAKTFLPIIPFPQVPLLQVANDKPASISKAVSITLTA